MMAKRRAGEPSWVEAIGYKKNPKSGRSDLLKGYTVGAPAPAAAVSSGLRIDQTKAGKYASNGNLRGVGSNPASGNVALFALIAVPGALYLAQSGGA